MLDETLAELYGVPTKVFNQAVRRNRDRFPPDFLLEVDAKEWEILRSQIVTLRLEHGRHRKYLPLAFTEHGAIMAATILNSPRAVQMSVYVVSAIVKLSESLAPRPTLPCVRNELLPISPHGLASSVSERANAVAPKRGRQRRESCMDRHHRRHRVLR